MLLMRLKSPLYRLISRPSLSLVLSSAVILACIASAQAERVPTQASPFPTIEQFIEIALGQEYATGVTRLRRWEQPLAIKIHRHFPVPTAVEPLIEELLGLLKEATQHPIGLASSDVNVDLYFVRQSKLAETWGEVARGQLPRDALCAAQIRTNRRSEIVAAVVLIPVDQAMRRGKLLSCIVEELTQVTGLANDSDSVYPSIFNDNSTDQMLTPLDWILLRTLYHSDLSAGMTEAEVREHAAGVMQRLKSSNEAQNAAQRIGATQLSELLNID